MYELNGLETADSKPVAGEPSAPEFKLRVTAEMLNIFCQSYRTLAGEMPDPSAVRASLELVLRLDSDGVLKLHAAVPQAPEQQVADPATGRFIVYGEAFTGKINLGSYGTFEEALEAAQEKGLFGEPGEIRELRRTMSPGTGKIKLREHVIYGKRWTPRGIHEFGFMDLREFEYGVRPAAYGHVLVYNHDVPACRDGVLQPRGVGVRGISAKDLRRELLSNSDSVGVWRLKGKHYWQGEFIGRNNEQLDGWLPKESYTDDSN